MDNISYFYFYVSLPLCIVLLWLWKTHIRGNGFDRSAWMLGFTMLAGLYIVAPVLPLTRYMPGFVIHRGYFFSYLNGTFNSFFMAYAVLNFHTADNPRIIPISLGFLVTNIFVSNWLTVLRSMDGSIGMQMLVFTIQGLYMYLFVVLIDGFHLTQNVMTWSVVTLTRDLAANLYRLLQNAVGIDDMMGYTLFPGTSDFWTHIIRHLLFLLVYGIVAFAMQKLDKDSKNVTIGNALVIGITVLIVTGPLYAVIRNFQRESFVIGVCCKLLYVIIYLLLLFVRLGVNQRASLDAELLVTRQILYKEKKHYQTMRDNIDLVNIRCHDINRQLKNLQNKLTAEELASLQEAVRIYDSNIRTGSDICDMVLYQKSLFCQQHQIRLSYIVDGKSLRFIRNTDLYALLENILENAIEAVAALDDLEKRIIDLTVCVKDDHILLEANNYFDPNTLQEDLSTTKADRKHHGYGLKSIRYIISEYLGDVNIFNQDDIFTVQIRIPIPKTVD